MERDDLLLNDITFFALDHGIASIEDCCGPLCTFVLTEDQNGKRSLCRIEAESIERSLHKAKEIVDNSGGEFVRYAIAWDGYVTIEDKKWDVILVESGDKKLETGYLMYQRYEQRGLFKRKNVAVGNPALIDEPKSRLFRK